MNARPADGPLPDGPLPILAQLQSSRRARVVTWIVALLLHLPAVPQLRLFEGLFGDRDTLIGGQQEAIIPIDLEFEDDLPGEAPGPSEPTAPVEEPTTVELPPEPEPEPSSPPPLAGPDAGPPPEPLDAGPPPEPLDAGPPPELLDAGGPDALSELPDAEPPPEPSDADVPDGEAPPPSDADTPQPGPPIVSAPEADPIADAAAAKELQGTANVTILLVGKQLREHPVGKRLGELLTNIRQWKSFFQGSNIDPVRDVDAMVITAPELVRRSDEVVAVMSFDTDLSRARAAVEALVKRRSGSWLDDAPIPTAKVKVEGGERLFALVEEKKQLYVLPKSQEKDLARVGKLERLSGALPYAVKLSMVYPHRPLSAVQGAPPLSDQLTRMTLTVTTLPSGDADVLLIFEVSRRDAHAAARQSIQDYFDYVRALDTAASLLGKGVGLPEIAFQSHERSRLSGGKASTKFLVEGKATLSLAKLQRIFDLADQNLVRGR